MTFLALTIGCAFQENLPEKDITGKVIIPRAAATQMTYADPEGDGTLVGPTETTDVRLIGPVWLGAFSGMDTESFSYPHPSMGPIIASGQPGDTFPYGGTSVGRFDFGCYSALACKVPTGRFTDYEDVLDWFANYLAQPVKDDDGQIVDYPSTYQQACYDYYKVTSDEEMSFIGSLDFEENADGDFEASFYMPHTYYVEGMQIWGWMDAPHITNNPDVNGSYTTCESSVGREHTEYDEDFYEGRTFRDLLNTPSTYIADGDWTTAGAAVGALDEDGNVPSVTITLDIEVGAEEE